MLIVNQGPVVQSWISDNPGANINQRLCISVCRLFSKCHKMILTLIETKLLKKYFKVYHNKLLIGKFALYFKFPSCFPKLFSCTHTRISYSWWCTSISLVLPVNNTFHLLNQSLLRMT